MPTLSHAPLDEPGPLDITSTTQNGVTRLRAGIPSGYLDWRDADRIAVPAVAGGVILDGRLPNWLWAALARRYHTAAWVACYQPQLGGSVLVRSHDARFPVGHVLPDDLN